MGFKESSIEREIALDASKQGARLFRNNVGKAWIGKSKKLSNGDILIKNARYFHAGLCTGSSDQIGWAPVKITEDMLGKTLAVFTAVEVKTARGQLTQDQKRFLEAVRRGGGYGILGRSPEQVCQELLLPPWA